MKSKKPKYYLKCKKKIFASITTYKKVVSYHFSSQFYGKELELFDSIIYCFLGLVLLMDEEGVNCIGQPYYSKIKMDGKVERKFKYLFSLCRGEYLKDFLTITKTKNSKEDFDFHSVALRFNEGNTKFLDAPISMNWLQTVDRNAYQRITNIYKTDSKDKRIQTFKKYFEMKEIKE